MTRGRLVWSSLAISLPALAVIGGLICFYMDKVPALEANESRRVTAEYREVAADLRAGEIAGAFAVERDRTWKPVGKMSPGKWGFVERDGRVLVWYSPGDGAIGVMTEKVERFDIRFYFFIGSVAVAFALLLSTGLGISWFWRYGRERDDFLAAAAHDLTTPLVGLRGLVGHDDASASIVVERLIRMVVNMKDFLRLGGKRPSPSTEIFDLRSAYDEAYALFAEDFRDLLEHDIRVSGDRSLMVKGDRTLTVQILWNLLGNELKYGAPYGDVSVRFVRKASSVILEFADEGKGMSPREMRRAFDRYYRARTVRESGKGGFGIGLCTSREFSRAMGGDIEVSVNSPSGCVFSFSLPSA